MVNNNLYKVENTLRSIAKRYKSVKYSLGLAILFLMMGVSAFSEEVVAQEAVAQQEVMTNEQIASSKDNLRDSIGNLKSKIVLLNLVSTLLSYIFLLLNARYFQSYIDYYFPYFFLLPYLFSFATGAAVVP